MSRLVLIFFVLIAACPLVGCGGKPNMVSVKGKVTFDGKPLKGCKVAFTAKVTEFDPERHGTGYGITDENGMYELQHPNGTKGIFPGTYRVTFSAWVDNKGNVIPPEAKPSEVPGGVKNLLPPKYETLSDTPESASVGSSGGEFNFQLAK